ncbi:hypothetical protein AYO47_03480 [Planctomyces sp. SCGC AG-212-M04]|nr:hypothetical protein AYO47_03480 [Planctomyces sp. SCGC AG-212-M04]
MEPNADCRWWPFEVRAERMCSSSAQIIGFLTEASRRGVRAFVNHNETECGAVADSGRSCRIAWQGTQRAELILWNSGKLISKELYSAKETGVAFQQATSMALQWVHGE